MMQIQWEGGSTPAVSGQQCHSHDDSIAKRTTNLISGEHVH